MVSIAIPWIGYHFLLPVTLIASVIFRYNVFSSFYLVLILVYPYAPALTHTTKGKCASYALGVLLVSLVFILAQISFQAALLANSPYGSLAGDPCSEKETLLRYIGFERLDKMPIGDVFRFLLPDILTFIVSTIVLVLIKRITAPSSEQESQVQNTDGYQNGPSADALSQSMESSTSATKVRRITSTAVKNGSLLFVTMVTMALAGIANPSVFSASYLLFFMVLMTMWSLHGKMLSDRVAGLRVFVSFIAATHLLILFYYQLGFFQTKFPYSQVGARLMGLSPFINVTCESSTAYSLVLSSGLTWTEFVSPPLTFVMYWMLALSVRIFFSSDKSKMQSHGHSSSSRGQRRRKDERMVRSNIVEAEGDEMNLQPLVQEEETPHSYDAIAGPSTSAVAVQDEELTEEELTKPGVLHSISDWIFGLKTQSFYVLALVVMMAWSVTFHSWLTLILLMWSCILWLIKDRAWGTLCCSPAITFYAMLLICLQFIYSLNLTEEELPTHITRADNTTFNFSSFGLKHYYENNPSLFLGAQILYTCVFWIVFHQFVYVRIHKAEIEQAAKDQNSWVVRTSLYIKEKLSKYWILVVYGFLLAICAEGRPSGLKMIYAFFFTVSAFVFELSWVLWCSTLWLFLMTLVFYTMVVVLLVYTYQFDEFPGYWRSFTNFTDQELADLGLIKYERTAELLLRICIPTLFLLAVIFQKHYFHDRFLVLIKKRVKVTNDAEDENRPKVSPESGGSEESIEMQDLAKKEKTEVTRKGQALIYAKKGWELFLHYWYALVRLVWRLLEFHMWKLLIITVCVAALQKATLIYALLFVIWVAFIPVRSFRLLLYVITSAYIGLMILGSMFYQLHFMKEIRGSNLYYNCSFERDENTTWTHNYDFLDWVGFSKMAENASFFYHAQGYITIIIVLALERIVMRRQDWCRYYRRELKLPSRLTALYPSITHKEVDSDFLSCCKFFINYWFYKFGVEACYVMAVITIWVRADSFAVIYSIFFIISMVLRTRRSLARYWEFYVFILLFILIGEYAIALGMPSIWCANDENEYPWTTFAYTTIEIRDRLIRWLYLPDYIIPPYSTSLIVDVFQLLFAVCQLSVFKFENSETAAARGGDNKYLTPQQLNEVTPATNARPNFMSKKSRNILDQFKVAVFQYSFWVTAAIVFIAGTSRISLFCLGYLIAFFYLLSFHQTLLMGKPSRLLKVWNVVLGYNVAVIVLKISLQITSCVFIDTLEEKACVFVQLMSLVCARPEAYSGLPDREEQDTCHTPDSYTNAGLTWDFVCFLFLIIQRRIFQTYYFLHVSEDMRISMKLASRGAELFEEKLISEVNSRNAAEEKGVAQIRENMIKIREKYANIGKGHFTPVTHTEAMRSGDYVMFEDDKEKEERAKKEKDILNPLQMIHAAETVGIDKALEEREEDKRKLDEGEEGRPVRKETLRGRSREDLTVDIADGQEQEKEAKKRNVVVKGIIFVWELFMSGLDTFILWLNKMNCDYRNVALQLSGEKDDLAKTERAESPREESTEITIEPASSGAISKEGTSSGEQELEEFTGVDGPGQSRSRSINGSQNSELEPMDFDKDQMRVFRLFYAIWYSIIAHTDVVCYMLVILNLMLTASVLSLVLPAAIFLWSTLSTPRPTKRFWNFCIVFLEIVIIVRFVFQFEFFPWNYDAEVNLQKNNPFWWPRIIGIDQKERWSALDLAQLLAFFFHKLMLKVHGLWNKVDKNKSKESCLDNAEGGKPTATKEEAITKKIEQSKTTEQQKPSENEQGDENQNQEQTDQKPTKTARLKRAATSPFRFYKRILTQEFSAVTDVYIFIFLCDVINFVITIFGYWAFGKYATQATDVVSNISSNNVPTGFLVMLIIQFVMMFIDRALYLRKNLIGKLIFQVCLVIGVHVWMFFILPAINERPFYMNHVAQTWYFFKTVYFLLSAYQIRCGYPKRVLGNFLTKAYGTANLFLFKGYRAIPFLAELTAIMDWMFVDTTMGIGEWFKFQSVYAEVFELKCWRVFETNYPSPRATAKKKLVKYLVGGLLVFFLVAIIWFPLLFMNIALTIGGVTNNPVQASIQITAGTFEPLFQVIADSEAIRPWGEDEFAGFAKGHADNPSAALFLSTFSASQVVSIRVDGESKTVWAISPPQRQQLLQKLKVTNPNAVQIDFEWQLTRNPEKTSVVTASGNNRFNLTQNSTARAQLHDLLQTPGVVGNPAKVHGLFPRYVLAGSKSVSTPAEKLYSANISQMYIDTNLSIRYAPTDNLTSWWRVFESDVQLSGNNTDPYFEIVVFSDKVSLSSFSFLVSYGIIGLYISIVLVVGRFVRAALVGSTSTIMFQELPRVDRILQLCLDVYLVREEQEFQLEEDLYAKLIFLYRSPQTMISWTKPKRD